VGGRESDMEEREEEKEQVFQVRLSPFKKKRTRTREGEFYSAISEGERERPKTTTRQYTLGV